MQTFSQFLQIVEKFISEQRFWGKSKDLYEPIYYMLGLPAKRVRPALMLLGHQMFSNEYQQVLPLAFAYEAFHNFTLIHDDIMDEAPLRRGQATVHEKFGMNAGILSGDALLICVYDYIGRHTPSDKLRQVLECFNTMAIEVCEGQQMDTGFEKCTDVSIEEYLLMIKYKTAVLLGASLRTGAIMADAGQQNTQLCDELGINLGLAFQIQDDYLDIWGNEQHTGKQKAGDIIHGKKSAPYILALQTMNSDEKEQFTKLYNSSSSTPDNKIRDVMNAYENAGVRERVVALKNEYHQATMLALENISAPEESKKPLSELIEMLLDRKV